MATQYYTASSLDGFIADEDHSLSWLLSRDVDSKGPMGYQQFFEPVKAIVMGGSTFRWLLEHELDGGRKPWPYDLPSWVFTSREVPAIKGDVRFAKGSVESVHTDIIAAASGGNVWIVGGGDLAGQFADVGLLDEVWVQYAPVMLGSGAPLLPRRLELRLEELARNKDFACARYAVVRE